MWPPKRCVSVSVMKLARGLGMLPMQCNGLLSQFYFKETSIAYLYTTFFVSTTLVLSLVGTRFLEVATATTNSSSSFVMAAMTYNQKQLVAVR